MESDSSPAIKPIKWANVALRFAKTPNPSQQYQHLTSAEPVLLFKSGQTNRRLDQPANPKAGNPSLNSNAGCLKVVDTFRSASSIRNSSAPASKSSWASFRKPAKASSP